MTTPQDGDGRPDGASGALADEAESLRGKLADVVADLDRFAAMLDALNQRREQHPHEGGHGHCG